MGCCVSTNAKASPSPKPPHISGPRTTSKSPPPTHPLLEEETVKEVLSETPTFPKLVPRLQENSKNDGPFIKAAPLLTVHDKRHLNGGKKPFPAFTGDDLFEEVSEICSTLSESVSVSTEKREDNGNRNDELRELRQRSPARTKNRSSPGGAKRERTVGRSPGRVSEPSPNRLRPGGGSGFGRKRDSGDSSGRRSRSPVMRSEPAQSKTGLGRSQSARKTGKSPGRVGPGTRKMEEGEDKWPPTSSESLENPLVSLECFIFL